MAANDSGGGDSAWNRPDERLIAYAVVLESLVCAEAHPAMPIDSSLAPSRASACAKTL